MGQSPNQTRTSSQRTGRWHRPSLRQFVGTATAIIAFLTGLGFWPSDAITSSLQMNQSEKLLVSKKYEDVGTITVTTVRIELRHKQLCDLEGTIKFFRPLGSYIVVPVELADSVSLEDNIVTLSHRNWIGSDTIILRLTSNGMNRIKDDQLLASKISVNRRIVGVEVPYPEPTLGQFPLFSTDTLVRVMGAMIFALISAASLNRESVLVARRLVGIVNRIWCFVSFKGGDDGG